MTLEEKNETLQELGVCIKEAKRYFDNENDCFGVSLGCWTIEFNKGVRRLGDDRKMLLRPGNAAALREALEEIDKNTDLLDIAKDIAPRLHPSHSFVAVQIRKIVRAALAKPIRNCDMGTAEEQSERMLRFCQNHPRCAECPCCGHVKYNKCDLAWAQLPYEELENDGSK